MNSPLNKLLGIRTPIVLPPLAGAGGGALTAAVTKGGGFGFIAAGYTALKTLPVQIQIARDALSIPENAILPIGVGFITWELDSTTRNPPTETSRWPALDYVLEQRLGAIWFSFGDAKALIEYTRRKSPETRIFVQVQNVKEAIVAAQEWKPDVIVAQGSESGGHGAKLGLGMTTFTFVPQVVETLEKLSIDIPVLAAGGVTTGRQLVAALALGAAGVAVGTRMLATPEALYSQKQKELLANTSDGTATKRTLVFDLMRRTDDWPPQFDGRALQNKTTDLENFITDESLERERASYQKAVDEGDTEKIVTWSGQGVGLFNKIIPAEEVVKEITNEALAVLSSFGKT